MAGQQTVYLIRRLIKLLTLLVIPNFSQLFFRKCYDTLLRQTQPAIYSLPKVADCVCGMYALITMTMTQYHPLLLDEAHWLVRLHESQTNRPRILLLTRKLSY